MKKIMIVLLAGFLMTACESADKNAETSSPAISTDSAPSSSNIAAAPSPASQPPADTANNTSIEWLEGTSKDFGKMKEGEKLDIVFKFKNTGSKPLVITSVTPGCGCTVPETPKEPFAPGATGEIKAAFDSQGKAGMQSKQVTVVSNTSPNSTVLTFNVEVQAKKG